MELVDLARQVACLERFVGLAREQKKLAANCLDLRRTRFAAPWIHDTCRAARGSCNRVERRLRSFERLEEIGDPDGRPEIVGILMEQLLPDRQRARVIAQPVQQPGITAGRLVGRYLKARPQLLAIFDTPTCLQAFLDPLVRQLESLDWPDHFSHRTGIRRNQHAAQKLLQLSVGHLWRSRLWGWPCGAAPVAGDAEKNCDTPNRGTHGILRVFEGLPAKEGNGPLDPSAAMHA